MLLFQVDKSRQVDEAEGRLWADSKGFLYFETSAQSGEGINEMFQVCTVKCLPYVRVLLVAVIAVHL